MTRERGERFSLKRRLLIGPISWSGWGLMHALNGTVRFRAEGMEILEAFRTRREPVILCFWHEQIFSAAYYFRRRGIVVITSQHFDGECIGRIIRRLGYGTARGSSSRGAAGAVLKLREALAQGRDVGFTVDGPRGPRRRVKPGPWFLGRKTGAPVIPFHAEASRYWRLRSWDRFRIPKPFCRTLVKIGQPLYPTRYASDEEGLAAFQAEMDRLALDCEGRA
jgi:lysophospholipid acyltransferase (LPLAT)-like uncharacterized protein